ncbi:WhiB family transcriptional regulator [Cutibacterium granulosum]|uniref:Transcriptional regulator WhiB n=2 Tax=Cutibacterium granulosum TaxID=33011 RepID=U1GJ69_9ACTN|nr:WhiB family transcriptional regulator [Cutibacterium granulosum]MDU3272312.1 WhiB family transcriptional regulator [Cutibacterium sp.]ERF56889.1 putative regulatory protein [Cutibacterium granulosum DSM 20700]ERF67761.1 putative regulatory protein [Cutibacterium granulosum TM11]KAG9059974.1 WhiB family transcriptional regulator [Cutibacterium granulosum DSM 20700]MBS5254393.1 WhiB family transcriptional regulator [Cutibacterium granulosum]
MTGNEADDWTLLANCRGMADALFPDGKEQRRARRICTDCAVRSRCLAEALDNRIEWGVWGGMTERERRKLLRERPDVTSWRDVLAADSHTTRSRTSTARQ